MERERGRLIEKLNHGSYADTDDVRAFLDDMGTHIAVDLNAYSERLGIPLRVDVKEIERELTPYALQLSRALERLGAAVELAKAENIPESTLDGFVQGAVSGYTDLAGYGAAGMAIGSIIPGIGTAIGGAVGAWYGGQKRSKVIEEILNKYNAALDDVAKAIDAAERPVYGAVSGRTPTLVSVGQLDVVYKGLTASCTRYDELMQSGDQDEAFSALVDPFEDEDESADFYGPYLRRLMAHIGNHLSWDDSSRQSVGENFPPDAFDGLIERFYYDPDLLEVSADAAAYVNFGEVAVEAARAARNAGAAGPGIAISEARAFEAAGDFNAALTAFDRAVKDGAPEVSVAHGRGRVLFALDKHEEAAARLAETIGVGFSLANMKQMLNSGEMAPLVGVEPLKSFFGKGSVRSMIKAWFSKDSENSVVLPVGMKDKLTVNARNAYASEVDSSRVLLVLDDTMWGSGKNGVTVTSRNIIWCELWGTASWLELSSEGHGALAEISEDGQTLNLYGGEEWVTVPCPNEHIPALARLINATQ